MKTLCLELCLNVKHCNEKYEILKWKKFDFERLQNKSILEPKCYEKRLKAFRLKDKFNCLLNWALETGMVQFNQTYQEAKKIQNGSVFFANI